MIWFIFWDYLNVFFFNIFRQFSWFSISMEGYFTFCCLSIIELSLNNYRLLYYIFLCLLLKNKSLYIIIFFTCKFLTEKYYYPLSFNKNEKTDTKVNIFLFIVIIYIYFIFTNLQYIFYTIYLSLHLYSYIK